MVGSHKISHVLWNGGDGKYRNPADHLDCLGPPDDHEDAMWSQEYVPPSVPGDAFEEGARLLCLSIPRKPNVRQTLMAGPREPRQNVRRQGWVRRGGRIGSQRKGGIHIVRSAAHSKHYTGKLSKASRARPSCL